MSRPGHHGPRPGAPYEPTDATAPLSVYGRSKLDGERAALAGSRSTLVVRTAWVYTGASGGTDFVSVMRARAEAGASVQVVVAGQGPQRDASEKSAVAEALAPGERVPAPNAGAGSRWEQARAVYAECGADPGLVEPVRSADHPRPAPRPSYSVLGSAVSTAAGVPPLRDWRAALAAAMR